MARPEAFNRLMSEQLGEEWPAFERSYEEAPHHGLRVNTLKISVGEFLEKFPYPLEPVPWCEDGFFYREQDPVTKHPYFYAGLFYLQEPSAMAPATQLKVYPGEVVLDLCAAPGGKSLQLAAVHREGPLLINDISFSRLKTVLYHLEKYGVKNAIVLNADERAIGSVLAGRVDALLVDAPCSGEGMFRRDPKATGSWESRGPGVYVDMQAQILDQVPGVLRPGGRMVYSTCTFNRSENEDQMETLLEREPLHLLPVTAEEIRTEEGFGRIWPHRHPGEGHFVARLEREGEREVQPLPRRQDPPMPEAFAAFVDEAMIRPPAGIIRQVKHQVYALPEWDLDLKGLKVLRTGWLLGEIHRDRFTPSNALAIGADPSDFQRVLDLTPEDPRTIKYLKGETIFADAPDGYTLVAVDGHGLGFAKISKGSVKNLYQKTWRMK